MRAILLLFVILCNHVIIAQNCSCAQEFDFIKSHIETNHGGFNKKIKSPEEPAYKTFTTNLRKEILELKNQKYCIAYLKKYILFLQDHHSNIYGAISKPVNESSVAAIDSFLNSATYRSTEIIALDTVAVLQQLQQSTGPIEGIYQTSDGTYRVAVLKKETQSRDYAGIMLSSKTRLWTKGQVKFELKQTSDSTMQVFTYLRTHGLNYDEISYRKNSFQIPGWEKLNSTAIKKPGIISNELIRFTVLDSQTAVLSIRSFSSSVYKPLDSAYKEIIPQIKKYPNLIIDVRNNGGGADFAYQPLMPLLYTDKIYGDVVDIYNTPANLAAYQKFDSISVSKGNENVFSRSRKLMEKNKPYTFVPMGDNKPSVSTFPVNKGFPNRIAILYNKGCASSCESLLFDAMYSKKTVLVGENSGGYTGYGDVMSIQTPCGNTLSWTTTVYREQWKYEFVGIPPQYQVPADETDWINYTRQLLTK